MWKDPVVEEIHKVREENAAKFNFDLDALFEDLKHFEDELKKSGQYRFASPSSRTKGCTKSKL